MHGPVICIGAIMVDELFFCKEDAIAGTSNPASLQRSAGGVVRNIAHHLSLLDIPVQLITVTGNDADGKWLLENCRQIGIGTDAVLQVEVPSGKYASVLNSDGSLFVAACVDPCAEHLTAAFLASHAGLLKTAAMVIADTNISEETLNWIIRFANEEHIPLVIEPVSIAKARKLSLLPLAGVWMVTPNTDELPSLCSRKYDNETGYINELLGRGVKQVWLRKGAYGSGLYSEKNQLELEVPRIRVKDSTGAGDAALAGWVAACYHGYDPTECLRAGHTLAMEVLQVQGAVKPGITMSELKTVIKKYYPNEE